MDVFSDMAPYLVGRYELVNNNIVEEGELKVSLNGYPIYKAQEEPDRYISHIEVDINTHLTAFFFYYYIAVEGQAKIVVLVEMTIMNFSPSITPLTTLFSTVAQGSWPLVVFRQNRR
jgi:hypothetical protein